MYLNDNLRSTLHCLVGLVEWSTTREEMQSYRDVLHAMIEKGDIEALLNQVYDEVEIRE